MSSAYGVYALGWRAAGNAPHRAGLTFGRGRVSLLSEEPLADNARAADYTAHRIALGLPDGAPDLEPEKTLFLEAGFDELGGIAWDKGCYMGQELTARTKYRRLVKCQLVPVAFTGPAPALVTPADDRRPGGGRFALLRGGIRPRHAAAGCVGQTASCRTGCSCRLPIFIRLIARSP